MKTQHLLIFTSLFSVTISADSAVQYDIRVDGITCPFCVATSEQALKKIDGISHINSNLDSGTISVCGRDSLVLEEETLRALFLKKGLTYRSMSKTSACSQDGEAIDSTPTLKHGEHLDVEHDHAEHDHD